MRRHLVFWLFLCFWAVGGLSCSGEAEVKQLTLSITSDAPANGGRIDTVRILFRSGDNQYPLNPLDERFNLNVAEGEKPVGAALLVAIDSSGSTFSGDKVWVQVLGMGAGSALTQFEGEVDLTTVAMVGIHLSVLSELCDADGDLFMDCDIEGCCAAADSDFGDCHPDDDSANPWAEESSCEPCSDTIDQDCDGADTPCIDEDGDGVADCAELECGANDSAVGPGLSELCDGVDNDCDGSVDDGFLYGQKSEQLAVGDICGLGTCTGVVACASLSEVTCDYTIGPVPEVCGDGLDNDCDGVPDNGCEKIDIDGDGYPEEKDCDDLDSATHPNAAEGCCPAILEGNPDVTVICDQNCDGELIFCDPEDEDGDGYWGQDDCDPNKASVHVGAPEKCGDGIDQDCFGGDLPCEGLVDEDGDQWPASVDCNDLSADVYPTAPELCDDIDNDCDGIVDEGNPGNPNGSPCTVEKIVGACRIGKSACDHSNGAASVICLGEVLPTDELCDQLDNDCDGETDEGFTYGGADIGFPCTGIGQCGEGTVQCQVGGVQVTCSSMPDGSASQASPEVCDGIDNDCDGELNEGLTNVEDSTCLQEGVCALPGAEVKAACNQDESGTWSCDYSAVPAFKAGKETLCDGVDNNCDGVADESFNINLGCDGADADECANGVFVCAEDGLSAICEEGDTNGGELCDGLDNDCDGIVDEDFKELGQVCDGDDSDLCINGTWQCSADGKKVECVEVFTDIQESCDGLDNDCDGTIDEDFPTLGEPCDGPDKDLCLNGTFTCAQAGLGVWCVNEIVSVNTDLCNGLDDDCDGLIDEDSGTQTCGEGECLTKVNLCEEGIPQVCQPMEGASPEVCDGLDNDCDGVVDEEFGEITCGQGECFQEIAACLNGELQACEPLAGAQEELCDGLDNDCNGVIDDGCPGAECPVGFNITDEGFCVSLTDENMLYVPSGAFMMGCPVEFDDDAPDDAAGACNLGGLKNSNPSHNVALDAFAVERTEVIVSAYKACVDAGVCKEPEVNDTPPCKSSKATWDDGDGGEFPVNFVNHEQAQTYCEWKGARLCTEAEWEMAARGTSSVLYPWGYDTPTCDLANHQGCGNQAQEVGSLPMGVGVYGTLDMAGNLTEWTADYFASQYYASSPEENPQGPDAGGKMVGRGGFFNSSAYDVRSYRRFSYSPKTACHYLGFRCCQDAP